MALTAKQKQTIIPQKHRFQTILPRTIQFLKAQSQFNIIPNPRLNFEIADTTVSIEIARSIVSDQHIKKAPFNICIPPGNYIFTG